MRILIGQPRAAADVLLVGEEVGKALELLEANHIQTEGGGTIESDGVVTGVIVIKLDAEVGRALEVLAAAGFTASIG